MRYIIIKAGIPYKAREATDELKKAVEREEIALFDGDRCREWYDSAWHDLPELKKD